MSAVTRSAEDHARYTRQLAVVREICDTYEKEPDNTDKVVELMQRMQECGQPPPDIVKELGGGVELDENGMPKGLVSGLQMAGTMSMMMLMPVAGRGHFQGLGDVAQGAARVSDMFRFGSCFCPAWRMHRHVMRCHWR